MVVLARRPGKAVQIGPSAELRVLTVSGQQLWLGVVCPRGLRIMRTEVIERQLTAGVGRSRDTAPIASARPVGLLRSRSCHPRGERRQSEWDCQLY